MPANEQMYPTHGASGPCPTAEQIAAARASAINDAVQAPAGDIGWAQAQLGLGQRVARRGWNGKGMYLVLVPGSKITIAPGRPMGKADPKRIGETVEYHAHVDMWTAQGYFVPWLCSQADFLATDWVLAE